MNIILLSGGSGRRLWPLSNDIRSKQFIKIFKDDNGEYESMLQRMYRKIKSIDKNAEITIATSKTQVSAIHNQIGLGVGVSIEPERRDTFPAIALAALYLHDIKGVKSEEAVVVCPVDPYVADTYFEALEDLYLLANKEYANLTLMGIEPTYPSEKYGYIIPESNEEVSKVKEFKEKPNLAMAKKYIENGALWNGGIFAFKLSYLINKTKEITGYSTYENLLANYKTLKKISFDYAIAENEKNIGVMRFHGEWKDLGTWNTLTESMDEETIGKAIVGQNNNNVHIINELNIPILAMGMNDVVISASPEGILVSDKGESSYIKPYVDSIKQDIMFAEKSWGSYKVVDFDDESMTVKVTLLPGHKMNYHSHLNRDEVWVITSGMGETVVDGMRQNVSTGDVITMKSGCRHTIIAKTELRLIEVQLGKEISVNDKQKYNLE